jgi:hypothetical protein
MDKIKVPGFVFHFLPHKSLPEDNRANLVLTPVSFELQNQPGFALHQYIF